MFEVSEVRIYIEGFDEDPLRSTHFPSIAELKKRLEISYECAPAIRTDEARRI